MQSKPPWFSALGMILAPPFASAQQSSRSSNGRVNTNRVQGSHAGQTPTGPRLAFNGTDGLAGTNYAGSQAQNSNSTASVSQYHRAWEMQLL